MLFLRGITYKMIQPIRNLRDYLLNLTNEEAVPTSQLAYSKNEVEVLAGSIENLVLRIRENDRALEEAKRANLQAQINNLEAQINPHFLYNTLSVIGCIGIENGLEDVYVMCETLAELLRYSIRYENMMVPFGREIENIEQYLFLMKKRYEGGLEIEWNLDNTLDDIFIPKLVFQPIVENAFAHGFEMEKPPWNLVITTKKTENKWYFTVKNNGKPFDMAIYKKICSRMQSFQQNMECSMETEGYGLENTLMRLYYTYGENYSFEVTSEDGWVCIMIGGGLLGKEI
jgi:sensor histidine kinase YesM